MTFLLLVLLFMIMPIIQKNFEWIFEKQTDYCSSDCLGDYKEVLDFYVSHCKNSYYEGQFEVGLRVLYLYAFEQGLITDFDEFYNAWEADENRNQKPIYEVIKNNNPKIDPINRNGKVIIRAIGPCFCKADFGAT